MDRRHGRLVLARDRLGVRPMFYSGVGDQLVFGSEIKALLVHPSVPREIDPVALGEVFTTWSPVPPRTMFKAFTACVRGICWWPKLTAAPRSSSTGTCDFPEIGSAPRWEKSAAAEHLRELLLDATRLRLRADVPVAAYVVAGWIHRQ